MISGELLESGELSRGKVPDLGGVGSGPVKVHMGCFPGGCSANHEEAADGGGPERRLFRRPGHRSPDTGDELPPPLPPRPLSGTSIPSIRILIPQDIVRLKTAQQPGTSHMTRARIYSRGPERMWDIALSCVSMI